MRLRRFTGSKESRESTPEKKRGEQQALLQALHRTRPRQATPARRAVRPAAATRQATGRLAAPSRLPPAAAPVATASSCDTVHFYSWRYSLFFQIFSEQAKRAKDSQLDGRN